MKLIHFVEIFYTHSATYSIQFECYGQTQI